MNAWQPLQRPARAQLLGTLHAALCQAVAATSVQVDVGVTPIAAVIRIAAQTLTQLALPVSWVLTGKLRSKKLKTDRGRTMIITVGN